MIPELMSNDLRRVGDVGIVGAALALFAKRIYPGGEFEYAEKGKQWIYRPYNFVTFHVQARNPVVVLSLSGSYVLYYKGMAEAAGLYNDWVKNVDRGMGSYSTYKIVDPAQLLAAAQFIQWASDYYKRHGRRRAKAATV